MSKVTYTVQPREMTGKKVKQLRRERVVPANIYAKGQESVSVQTEMAPFTKLYDQVGETTLVYLTIDGEKKARPVLIDEIQRDPVTWDLLHVAFKQVDLTQTIEADIPIEFVGEVEIAGSVIVPVRDTITVEALPTDLPEVFEVDITSLENIGDMISLNALQFDKDKVKLVGFESDEDLEKPLIIVQEQKEEEEPEEVEPELAEGEDSESEAPAGDESPATDDDSSSDDSGDSEAE